MLSFLFDILSFLVHGAGAILSFLVHSALDLFSGIASIVSWPIRTMLSTLGDWWGVPTQWTPLYIAGGAVLLLLLLVLAGWALAANRKKNPHR